LSIEIEKLIKIIQQKRKKRKENDLDTLYNHNIDFKILWNGQVRLETNYFRIDYFPETGEWNDKMNFVIDFGVDSLIKYVNSFYGN
jgi:hypothetical protein